MFSYPLFIDLSKCSALVIGAGKIGQRKINALLQNKIKKLTIIDELIIALTDENKNLLGSVEYKFLNKEFQDVDVLNNNIVFAATNNNLSNKKIAEACFKHNILCNVLDDATYGTCIVPAKIKHEYLQIGISTGGISPSLSKNIKADLEKYLANRYDKQLIVLKKLRPKILSSDLIDHEKVNMLDKLASYELLLVLNQGNKIEIEQELMRILANNFQQEARELGKELGHELV